MPVARPTARVLAAAARGALAATLLVTAAAGVARAQDPESEIQYDSRGKPIRRPGGYRTPSSNPTTGPYAGRTEFCFGGVGPMCQGAPGSPNGWSESNNATMMYVSVGSILHDNCCLKYPSGKFCGGPGANGSGTAWEFNHDGMCVKEWDKAWWNTLDNRQWRVAVSHSTPSDLTVVEGRRSRLRDESVTLPQETRASRQYAAPAGVALDPGDEAFCASGRAETRRAVTGVTWIVCQ